VSRMYIHGLREECVAGAEQLNETNVYEYHTMISISNLKSPLIK
jgi:hypothetical protein